MKRIIISSMVCLLLAACSRPAENTHFAPVNPNATPEAKALLERLYKSVDDGKIISGLHHNEYQMMDHSTMNADLDRIYDACGKVPMIWGGDLAWEADQVIDYATKAWNEGHIVTLMWHVNRPFDKGFVKFKEQVQGKLTDQEWDDLLTPGTEMNNLWCAQVDSISNYLKVLQDRNIPVLWRPYHENNGEWFWWGWRQGEKGFPALYRMLYDRMVNVNHLNNLLWVWNANAPRDIPGDTALAYDLFFPGLDYVDVLATDVYNHDWKQSHHDDLLTLANGKLIALGELGNLPTPQDLETQNKYAWFMIWTGFTRPESNSPEEIKAVFDLPQVVNYEPEQ